MCSKIRRSSNIADYYVDTLKRHEDVVKGLEAALMITLLNLLSTLELLACIRTLRPREPSTGGVHWR